MDLLQMIWVGIDFTILLTILWKNSVQNGQGKIQQRSIESGTTLDERFLYVISLLAKLIGIFIVNYIIVYLMPNNAIQVFLNWYITICVGVLISTVGAWIIGNVIVEFSYTNLIQLIIMTTLSVVGKIFDIDSVEKIGNNRTILNMWIVICIVSFYSMVLNMWDKRKKNFYKQLPKRGIRKDLYYRISKLEVGISTTKLARYCERYFDTYLKKYQKLGAFL